MTTKYPGSIVRCAAMLLFAAMAMLAMAVRPGPAFAAEAVKSAPVDPALLQRQAAISPSLWWDHEALSRRVVKILERRDDAPAPYVAIANEGGEMQQGFEPPCSRNSIHQDPIG